MHLGSGAVLRVGAYSASANTFTDFPWSPAYRLGTHDVDGGEIAVDLTHAGSTVRLELAAAGDGCVTGRLTCTDMAEWGLRFWLLLEFGTDEPADPAAVRLITPPGREYLQPPVALLDRGSEGPSAAFGTLDRPADARLTMERGVLGTLMESQSYYARPPAPERGRFAVFRISATDPVTVFAAAAGPDADGGAGPFAAGARRRRAGTGRQRAGIACRRIGEPGGDPRRARLEHDLGPGPPAGLHGGDQGLDRAQVRRLRRLADRRVPALDPRGAHRRAPARLGQRGRGAGRAARPAGT